MIPPDENYFFSYPCLNHLTMTMLISLYSDLFRILPWHFTDSFSQTVLILIVWDVTLVDVSIVWIVFVFYTSVTFSPWQRDFKNVIKSDCVSFILSLFHLKFKMAPIGTLYTYEFQVQGKIVCGSFCKNWNNLHLSLLGSCYRCPRWC